MAVESITKVTTGLGTISFSVLVTGNKTLDGKINLPNIIEGLPVNSQVVVTVNLNGGATLYTGLAGAEGFKSGGFATAGDTFNVILTSSLAADQAINAVKSTISFY